MIDLFLTVCLGNTIFALCLALVAILVSKKTNCPPLVHLLWLLVFVKLVTPPLLKVSVPASFGSNEQVVASQHLREATTTGTENTEPAAVQQGHLSHPERNTNTTFVTKTYQTARPYLVSLWGLGTLSVFFWSLFRVAKFNRLLKEQTETAPKSLRLMGNEIAARLNIRRPPSFTVTKVHLIPMVWWCGGHVRVIIPQTLLQELPAKDLRWVLAHELAHVKRRDYLTRWLQWIVYVLFWWNPVVWWADRNLRAVEEVCCDSLVLSCLNAQPREYGNSLLLAIEHLASPAFRPPALASQITSGGFIQRRFEIMLSRNSEQHMSWRIKTLFLLLVLLVLPLGFAAAQDYEAVFHRLNKAVDNGEITREEAGVMMSALKHTRPDNEYRDKSESTERRERRPPVRERRGRDRRERDLRGRIEAERIEEAVERGNITREEADIKHREIRERIGRQRGREHGDRAAAARNKWEGITKLIEGAVERGEITREEADEKYREMKERMARERDRGDHRSDVRDRREDRRERVKEAVERGNITHEEADIKRRVIRERIGRQRGREHGDRGAAARKKWEGITKLIEEAVERGEITREEADERYREMKERMAREPGRGRVDHRHDVRDKWEGIRERIEGAVERGEITREEANDKYREIKERMARERERGRGDHPDERHRGRHADRNWWEGIRERIEGVVERGEITREEANDKYRELRERMGRKRLRRHRDHDGDDVEFDWKGVKRRIEGAVERGEVTREEADTIYQALRQRPAGEPDVPDRQESEENPEDE